MYRHRDPADKESATLWKSVRKIIKMDVSCNFGSSLIPVESTRRAQRSLWSVCGNSASDDYVFLAIVCHFVKCEPDTLAQLTAGSRLHHRLRHIPANTPSPCESCWAISGMFETSCAYQIAIRRPSCSLGRVDCSRDSQPHSCRLAPARQHYRIYVRRTSYSASSAESVTTVE
jgi:hypothetical protein